MRIVPGDVVLEPPLNSHRLLLVRDEAGLNRGVAESVEWTVADPAVVELRDGIAVGLKDGATTITAKASGQSASIGVTVRNLESGKSWEFRNHVQSVLSKTGCNMGACHGATAGKNGFKLSLRGYDPETDFFVITRQARGRRVVPSDPGRSLLLTKPTGAIPHKGGVRFDENSLEYRVISEWIAQGQPAPSANDARIVSLEMDPPRSQLPVGGAQQFLVRARFSDGRVEDVTRWAKYNASNFSVCTVNDQGLAKVGGPGEGAVTAWYLAQNVTATITSPHPQAAPSSEPPARANFIDDLVLKKLASLNIPASPRCTDSEFIRRAYLDIAGILPTVEETQSFLADATPDKRARLVDHLLTRSEYVDYWTYRWSDLLLVSGARLRPEAVKSFSKWIRTQVAENRPWDEFARGVVQVKGGTFDQGAANFYALHQDPLEMSETLSSTFLGMSINCARCHDHPLEKWTNDDYYGMASLFARVRGKGWGGDFRNGDGNRTIFPDTAGELIQPRTGRPQKPRPLDGRSLDFVSDDERRAELAAWLTSSDNPYFAKAIVNRVWANFLGVGLVEAVDDLRLTNPPSNPELFDALRNELIERKYDLKSLMRLITTSETYQRSSKAVAGNEMDQRYYSRAYPRRLRAETLLDAISAVTQVPTKFKDYPEGTRALELPDSFVVSSFLEKFGRPERVLTCECERSDEPSMTQVLHLTNGKTLLEKLEAKESRIGRGMAANRSPAEMIDEVFLASVCRLPTDVERKEALALIEAASPEDRRAAWEDLYWCVLTTREFLFAH